MTYITPDFVALREEARHYAQAHPLSQGPGFIPNPGFRGEYLPLLTAAPIPPITVKDYNPRVLGPIPGRGAVTISPMDRSFQDSEMGPGAFPHMPGAVPSPSWLPGTTISGLGISPAGTWIIGGGTVAVLVALAFILRRR